MGLTATGDPYMLDFLKRELGTDNSKVAILGRDFESPYKYNSCIKLVNDGYVEMINALLREGIHRCIYY